MHLPWYTNFVFAIASPPPLPPPLPSIREIDAEIDYFRFIASLPYLLELHYKTAKKALRGTG